MNTDRFEGFKNHVIVDSHVTGSLETNIRVSVVQRDQIDVVEDEARTARDLGGQVEEANIEELGSVEL